MPSWAVLSQLFAEAVLSRGSAGPAGQCVAALLPSVTLIRHSCIAESAAQDGSGARRPSRPLRAWRRSRRACECSVKAELSVDSARAAAGIAHAACRRRRPTLGGPFPHPPIGAGRDCLSSASRQRFTAIRRRQRGWRRAWSRAGAMTLTSPTAGTHGEAGACPLRPRRAARPAFDLQQYCTYYPPPSQPCPPMAPLRLSRHRQNIGSNTSQAAAGPPFAGRRCPAPAQRGSCCCCRGLRTAGGRHYSGGAGVGAVPRPGPREGA